MSAPEAPEIMIRNAMWPGESARFADSACAYQTLLARWPALLNLGFALGKLMDEARDFPAAAAMAIEPEWN